MYVKICFIQIEPKMGSSKFWPQKRGAGMARQPGASCLALFVKRLAYRQSSCYYINSASTSAHCLYL